MPKNITKNLLSSKKITTFAAHLYNLIIYSLMKKILTLVCAVLTVAISFASVKENFDYPIRHGGLYQLENNWIVSLNETPVSRWVGSFVTVPASKL